MNKAYDNDGLTEEFFKNMINTPQILFTKI